MTARSGGSGVDSERAAPVTFSPRYEPSQAHQERLLVSAGSPQVAPSRAAAPEIPFFMPVNGLPAFAVLHAAAPRRPDAPVVVHVHGLGVEQVTLDRSFQVALDTVFPRLSAAERARLEGEVWPGDVHGFLNVPLQRRALARTQAWLESFHPLLVAPPANGD